MPPFSFNDIIRDKFAGDKKQVEDSEASQALADKSVESAPSAEQDEQKVQIVAGDFKWPPVKERSDDRLANVRCLFRPFILKRFFINNNNLNKLVELYPYASAAITSLSDSDQDVLTWGVVTPIRPIILVGPPGCGKSSLAKDYCAILGIPFKTMNASGISESMTLSGCHRGYATSTPSIVTELIAQKRIANPCVIVNELDKAPLGRHNGNFLDTLLQLLEPSEASTFYDLCLDTSINASYVRWIFTANDVKYLPDPLKSRCRIVHVPSPKKEHVAQLVKTMIASIAKERGVSAAWFPIPQEVLNELTKSFRGDIRRLKQVVLAVVKAQVANWPKA